MTHLALPRSSPQNKLSGPLSRDGGRRYLALVVDDFSTQNILAF